MRVYLCGAINGCTDKESKEWRQEATEAFGSDHVIDPMDRDYRGVELDSVKELVELDKADIMAADFVLCYYGKHSAGTAMEVMYAWTMGKPVVVVPGIYPLSPWIDYHATHVTYTMKGAIEWINQKSARRRQVIAPVAASGSA